MSRYLIAPLLLSAALAVPGSASAQGGYYDDRRVAYDEGFREGLKEGEKDARHGDSFYFQDERAFQRGDKGYKRQYGDRERYRQVFRNAFADGYANGYRRLAGYGRGRDDGRYNRGNAPWGRAPYDPRYGNRGPNGRYPGGYGYYSPALDYGVRDGYEKGIEDARKNRSFDPLRHSWYRSGDRHYDDDYGSRDEYKNLYRRGFQEGYDRGFREGRYRY